MITENIQKYVISALLPDRVAILRDITTAIYGAHGNIEEISQTVLGGYFHVVLTASLPQATSADTLRHAIESNLPDQDLSVVVANHHPITAKPAAQSTTRYIITTSGEDKPGILKTITTFLAARSINIEDWDVDLSNTRATYIGEISVPNKLDIKQLQDEFRAELDAIGLQGGLQHENIFRATNEVGPIRALLGGIDHD